MYSVPSRIVEGITILSKAQVSTQCAEFCLLNGIDIIYMSIGGNVYGRLTSSSYTNAKRQRRQIEVCKESFCIELAKKTLSAKIFKSYRKWEYGLL